MLTAILWTKVGQANGALGTVVAICYRSGQAPPNLPVFVMVRFDSYRGPTLPDGTVPISPIHHTWFTSGAQCSHLQLPLKLAWAVTIHKAQGLTLDKVVIDVGKKEFSCGLTFVACSRVCRLTDVLFDPPFPFKRVANLARSQCLQERLFEDARLRIMKATSLAGLHPPVVSPPLWFSSTPFPPPINPSTPCPPQSHPSTLSPLPLGFHT